MQTQTRILITLICAALLLACLPGNLGQAVAPNEPTTAPNPPITFAGGVIVDNADPGFAILAGEWGACRGGECQGAPFNADFRFADAKCLACRARFELRVATAGSYELYAWWPNGADRATDTPFTITYSGGTNTVRVDQRNSGDDWFWLQTINAQAGETISVVIGGAASGFANADALALAPTGAPPSSARTQPTAPARAQPTSRPADPTPGQPIAQPTAAPIIGGLDPNPPGKTLRLVFIHHSTGENWLADDNGGLGIALRDNNYFVSDTNYGWGPDGIGDTTDIGHWWTWFRSPNSPNYLRALYAENGQHAEYARRANNPGGENQIVLIKSCFPNSQMLGKPNDPPTTGNNPLRGQEAGDQLTVANAKGIYNDLLPYFATRQDKLFVIITQPPLSQRETNAVNAANARAFATWLARDWLKSYPHKNVFVFDFYNILTSNAGNANKNDAGQESGNHHRVWKGAVQSVQSVNNNFSAYPSAPDDSHPSNAGNKKATAEFIPLLNGAVHCWLGDGSCAAR
ncbi:MAG: hypothetical protein HZC40_20915 [Chloroflexi bacterium]|nr:hypothetical protein [Chloroflexota bacterium]